ADGGRKNRAWILRWQPRRERRQCTSFPLSERQPPRSEEVTRPATWLPAVGNAEGDRHPRAAATLPKPDNVGGRWARPPPPLGPSQALPLMVATKLGHRRQHRTLMLTSLKTRTTTIIARVLFMTIGPRQKSNEPPIASGARLADCARVDLQPCSQAKLTANPD
ncbi:unnamed protein product, partial [Ectocarpus sp. 13 AM-2016]